MGKDKKSPSNKNKKKDKIKEHKKALETKEQHITTLTSTNHALQQQLAAKEQELRIKEQEFKTKEQSI